MLVIVAGIAGLVVAIVIMLYSAIEGMIQAVRPDPSERQGNTADRKRDEDAD